MPISAKDLRLIAFSMVALLILSGFMPLVSARGPRSGRLITQDEIVVVSPDPSVNWTVLLNAANGSDYKYLDYNLTWEPFFENHTDIRGILVHSVLPPMLYSINATNQTISTASLFRVGSDVLMDGASEIWVRLPVLDIPLNATMRLRFVRVADVSNFNMTYATWALAMPTRKSQTTLVHDITLDPNAGSITPRFGPTAYLLNNSWQGYKRWQNISVNANFTYNFTYLKACFGLFSNEWYVMLLDVYAPWTNQMKLAMSMGDFGSDSRYNSWVWCNGTSHYYAIDLDTPFVATYGLANGITGIGVRDTEAPGASSNYLHLNASYPIRKKIDNTSTPWVQILVPYLINYSGYFTCQVFLRTTLYSSSDDSVAFHHDVTGYSAQAGNDFIAHNINVTTYNNTYLDHIRLDFHVNLSDATKFKLWGSQHSKNATVAGFTDVYFRGRNNPFTEYYWALVERQWFLPVGYVSLSATRWNLTNHSIVVIPVNTPKTPLEIVEVMQKFEAYLKNGDISEKGAWDHIQDFFRWVGPLYLKFWSYATGFWLLEHFFGKDLNDVCNAIRDLFLFWKGVGLWIWSILKIVIDALEYYTYWAVRVIYSFSIGIVYMVNVFGIISINSALFAVARTGNGKDFIRAFRIGWKFIFGIISLLLSLAILAISIVSAVVPF